MRIAKSISVFVDEKRINSIEERLEEIQYLSPAGIYHAPNPSKFYNLGRSRTLEEANQKYGLSTEQLKGPLGVGPCYMLKFPESLAGKRCRLSFMTGRGTWMPKWFLCRLPAGEEGKERYWNSWKKLPIIGRSPNFWRTVFGYTALGGERITFAPFTPTGTALSSNGETGRGTMLEVLIYEEGI